MPFSFVGQPFADSPQIGTIVTAALGDGEKERAWFLAAWGKQSGLSRLATELSAFRERGGSAEAVLGLDEGGATVVSAVGLASRGNLQAHEALGPIERVCDCD